MQPYSRRRNDLRNLAITAVIVLGVLIGSASVGVVRLAFAQTVSFTLELDPGSPQVQTGDPGAILTYNLRLTNREPGGSPSRIFNLTVTGATFTTNLPFSQVTLAPGEAVPIPVQVIIPSSATAGSSSVATVRATRQSDNVTAQQVIITNVTPGTATPTRTTGPTATSTVGPTATPGPVCGPNGTSDASEPNDSPREARRLDVNRSLDLCIGRIGDEDWISFGGIGGKVYTIDVPEMSAGLDLSLELYNAAGERLATNDDFFNRDSARPNPNDLRPRIESWVSPIDGTYYVRIRDAASGGGANLSYKIQILGESYGPTPTTVGELCMDLFEPDGLPEQARLITSNERQPRRTLCPNGDADWVRFFGKSGGRYILYTDSQPYADGGNRGISSAAGVDTFLTLVDRDGVAILATNDDIPGGSTLDSQISFVPTVDGFYYAQVKNRGDIGNQFLRYDLVLLLCTPDQANCGRTTIVATTTLPPAATSPAATPTATARAATATPTISPTPSTTAATDVTRLFAVVSGGLLEGPANAFVDQSFAAVWGRTDSVVAAGRIQRSWVWGPRPRMARAEPYAQGTSGLRQVQYFDKARMEVNNPAGDRASPAFVTNGLLVVELISGRMQLGDAEFEQRGPATFPLAGDEVDADAPTYASMQGLMGPVSRRVGATVAQQLLRSGEIVRYDGRARPETRIAVYIEETGHNISQVFWDFMHARGLVQQNGRDGQAVLVDWLPAMGYPVSEPYWVRVDVGGVERDVLVQAFERRVLTYSPDNPTAWRVEMGNVGRHYYRWRYGTDLP